ncbi:MAG: monovalent cation/H+ antiporter subunit D [Candidatus Accumulibacter phosphatis]|uniref:Monovalent cation/H+ antiporter subunit D n=1 Tax=Candidatus Accumulibacter contiguus TaxID=2954381 RepID=A0ABX1TCA6_9PROT|nr:monovalent cation/H+ antiporter subunit D [Candidatus Accumulibacter contiguus]NMQ05877.1 monovalent cation/H+ antiporter subunit D [Candidatus Accumulibacter contiguus]
MITHAPILPILIPFAAALLQLLGDRLPFQRVVGGLATALLVLLTAWLALLADDGQLRVYALGDWPAPFGIVLVVDRLAAAMTLLTAVLGFVSLLYASAGFDQRGRHFHPLFQLQLLGLLGAFLTGDLFNLFVFFEVMLLASYTLLAHAGGLERTRAGITYVVLNLLGSALFLIALGLLYGTLGTLNLADLAYRLTLPGHDQALARLAFALLIAVFLLKAGLLPLSFWLPHAYSAAGAPVAALFAIMTKVGIVAILRVQVIALAPTMPDLLDHWLTALALATVVFAALGTLVAVRLRALAAWLVLLSAGALLVTPAQASAEVSAAAIYYLVQSTLAGAAFFLLAGVIAEQRGSAADHFTTRGASPASWLKVAFLVAATTAAGLPPFSGFVGKLMLLTTLRAVAAGPAIWVVLLCAGFVVMIALARDGCHLIWKNRAAAAGQAATEAIAWQKVSATLLLVAAGPLLAVLARPLADYGERAAAQLHAPGAYVAGVLGPRPAKTPAEAMP